MIPLKTFSALPTRFFSTTIFIIAFLLYIQTVSYEYVLDDEPLVKNNVVVNQGLSGLKDTFTKSTFYGYNKQNYGAYRPVTQFSFSLVMVLFGNSPSPQHAINVLLYAATCALLFILMQKMPGNSTEFSLAVVLLFTVHPVHTEVVANIKSRDEILSLLLGFIIPVLLLIKANNSGNRLWIILSGVVYMCGLLSKESALTYLVIFPVIFFVFFHKNIKDSILMIWPHLTAIALYFLLLRLFIEPGLPIQYVDNFLPYIDIANRWATIVYMLWQDARLSLFPVSLSWDYSYAQVPVMHWANPIVLLSAVVYIAAIILSVIFVLKRNVWAFCIIFYLVSISLYSNVFVLISATMADRFLFTSVLAVAALIVFLFQKTGNKVSPTNSSKVQLVTILPITILFIVLTLLRTPVWADNDTLYASGIINAPNSIKTNKVMGNLLMKKARESTTNKKGLIHKSLTFYKKAIRLYPAYEDGWTDMGTAYYIAADYDSAEYCWSRLKEINPQHERLKELNNFLADGFIVSAENAFKENENERVLHYLEKAIKHNPDKGRIYFVYGLLYGKQKDYRKSSDNFKEALKLEPTNVDYWYNLGGANFMAGDYSAADSAWQRTIAIRPDHTEALQGIAAIKNGTRH